jgi:hypothetical protein
MNPIVPLFIIVRVLIILKLMIKAKLFLGFEVKLIVSQRQGCQVCEKTDRIRKNP